MTRTDEFIGLLQDYLDSFEGPTPMPDALRDAIRAELPFTRQLRPVPGPRRMLSMFNAVPRPALIGLVVVLAVGVSLLGYGLLRGPAGVGTPSPTAIASPTPVAPTPVATPMAVSILDAPTIPSGNGATNPENLVAGTYYLDDHYPAHISFDVPTGWFLWDAADDYTGVLVDSPDAPAGSGWGIVFSVVGQVSVDPCDQTKGTLDATTGQSWHAVLTAMENWPGFGGTAVGTTVDGYEGALLTWTTSLDHAACPSPKLWTTPFANYWEDGYGTIGSGANRVMTYRLIQVGQAVLVIRTTEFPETSPFELQQNIPLASDRHADDLVSLQAIVDSIGITHSDH